MIKLIRNDGIRKSKLIHRLVAETFLPNPDNLPEVNHKDKNTKNPKLENLEWCTRKDNLYDSYKTMSPNRNFRKCKLLKDGKVIGEFNGIERAAIYAEKEYKASRSTLAKYLAYKNLEIEIEDSCKRKYIHHNKAYEKSSC